MRLLCTAALASLFAAPVFAGDTASGSDIESLIIGNTVEGGMADGTAYAEYYSQDGDIKADGYTGKWTVDGDDMCFDYGEGADCFQVKIDGDKVTWMSDGQNAGTGTIASGNPNSF